MTVVFLLFALGSISFFVPRKNIKTFFIFSGIIISGLFFCYDPPVSDDLYRYYQLYQTIDCLSLKEYLEGNYGTQDWLINHMLNDYQNSAIAFASLLFALSRIGIKEIMPFVFSLMTYIPLFMMIYEVCVDNNYSKGTMCLCFVMILACVDFRFVSCLRNLSAYSIFVYSLYKDIIKKSRKTICIVGYMIACGLHLACIPLVFMRFLAIVIKGRFQWVIAVALLFIKKWSLIFAMLVKSVLSDNSFMLSLAKKIEVYFLQRTNYNRNGAIFFCAVIAVAAIVYFALKKDRAIPQKYKMYEAVYLYIIAFTIGCVSQYDILMRNCKLIIMLAVPFIARFINGKFIMAHSNIKVVSTYKKASRDVIISICLIGLILMSFLFYTLFSYIPMDECFWR